MKTMSDTSGEKPDNATDRQYLQDINFSNSMLQDHTVGEIKRAVHPHISRGLTISLYQGTHDKLLD